MGEVVIGSVAEDELDAFWRAARTPFGEAPDDDLLAYQRAMTEPDRTFAAREDGRLVALAAVQSLDVSLPGGAVAPLAAVSLLGVLPTHRRRGLGGALLRRVHDQARTRGEPLTGLWASEGGIYPNYGYGVGARTATATFDESVRWREPDARPAELRMVDVDDAVPVARALTTRLRERVAGVPDVSETRLRRWLFHDPPAWREGAGPRAFVAADGDRGLVSYRLTIDWDAIVPAGEARVDWLVADDPAVEAQLWRYVSQIDLVSTVRALLRPADDPLPLLATDARRVGMTVLDGLWLRVLDPAAVLSARRYAADGRAIVEVVDDEREPSRLLLTAGGGEGTCEPAPAAALADVTVPTASLAAVALGDERLTRLARAGLAEERTPGALHGLDRMLATDRAPWCPVGIE